jgi:hypothetical protein
MSLLDLIKEKQAAIAATRRGRTVKPPPGRSTWRILPSWRGENEQFWHDFAQHFIKDASENILAIYVDTEKTFGIPSEINALIGQAIKETTDDTTMTLLKNAKSSAGVLLNAIQVDGDKPGEVQILEVRPSVFHAILNVAQEYEDAKESIFDIKAGRELIIHRDGAGLNTKYTVNAAAKNKGVVPADVMKKLHNLDDYVKQENAEGAFKALNAVRQIAGLLPAPGTGGAGRVPTGIPTAARAALPAAGAAAIEDDYAVAPRPTPKAAVPSVEAFEDVPEVAVRPVAKATPAPAAAPAVAAAADTTADLTGDPDLDAMLASLGN